MVEALRDGVAEVGALRPRRHHHTEVLGGADRLGGGWDHEAGGLGKAPFTALR